MDLNLAPWSRSSWTGCLGDGGGASPVWISRAAVPIPPGEIPKSVTAPSANPLPRATRRSAEPRARAGTRKEIRIAKARRSPDPIYGAHPYRMRCSVSPADPETDTRTGARTGPPRHWDQEEMSARPARRPIEEELQSRVVDMSRRRCDEEGHHRGHALSAANPATQAASRAVASRTTRSQDPVPSDERERIHQDSRCGAGRRHAASRSHCHRVRTTSQG